MAGNSLVNMFKVSELRKRIFFTLAVLALFRLGCVITIPGIDAAALFDYFDKLMKDNAFASYMDFFVGGAFSNFSVFMLGVMPYISAQIILQLLMIVVPSIKRSFEEDGGQRKFALWTRVGTVIVCIIQSVAVTVYAKNIGAVSLDNEFAFKCLAVLTVTTGSMITVWLGDQITAHGIGNGISVLIFAGIVARIPKAITELIGWIQTGGNAVFAIIAAFIWVAIVAVIAFEEGGERKIPVNYAKRVVGRKMIGGQNTYIPFKVNPSNVIPLIFASSFLTLPLQIIQSAASGGDVKKWISTLASFLNPDGWWYNILLVVLIVFFAYFYTQVTLNPTEIAKQIRENGGSIPGVRADETEATLQKILNRLVLPGSLFLAAIAVIPNLLRYIFEFRREIANLMGGTSLIIMVGVATDTMAQIEALLKMHHQEGFVKKGKIRSRNI
ncbi:MAG: preprotein translocase subunit SecY [Treponema sp.]|uniref:preprotein translocase subunit SecY n=1 Tax=Treponema sp. TaxID=166 RepID=UPI00298DF7AB|nr:preprotein translocase subunit SecY [Treponema sp.]MBR5933729.1 preprotein translocase subunit SecY [Treponema sp.]